MVGVDTPLVSLITAAAKPLATRDVRTAGDLLRFLPTRYVGYDSDLGHLVEGDYVVVVGQVLHSGGRNRRSGRGWIFTATLTDGTRRVDMTFFNRGHETKLRPGVTVIAGGQLSRFNDTWQLAHPGYTPLDDASDTDFPGLMPVYPHLPKIHNWNVIASVRIVLESIDEVPDPIPDDLRSRRGLPTLAAAYRMLHRPDSFAQVHRARARMRYEEALVLQTILATRRAERLAETAVPRTGARVSWWPRWTGVCRSRSPTASVRWQRRSPPTWRAPPRCTGCCRARSGPARP